MKVGIVKRRGAWEVWVTEGRQPARHCPGVNCGGNVRRHRVWIDEHPGDDCPECGAPLGAEVTQERRRRRVGRYTNEHDAEIAVHRVSLDVHHDEYAPERRITVRDYMLDEWLPAAREQYKPSTFAAYESNVRNHVASGWFGATPLSALTAKHFDRLYADLRTRLSSRSVHHVHRVVHRALGDAVKRGYVKRNPAATVTAPRVADDPPPTWWTAEQVSTFVHADPGDRLDALWTVAARTGMRRGELAGLKWSAIDLDAGTVSVVETVTTAGYATHVAGPKSTKGRRSIAIGTETVAALRRHRARQAEERLAAGGAWDDTGHVFTREDGTPLHPQTIAYQFRKRTVLAGLPPIRLHDLRHSNAAAMVEAGVHTKVMQERLGHSSPQITLGIYGHVSENVHRDAAAQIEAALS